MESFVKNLETLIDQQEPKVRAGEDLAVFAIAFEGNEFAFRQLGYDGDVILILAHIIIKSEHVGHLLIDALNMAKNTMSGLDGMFIRPTRYEEELLKKCDGNSFTKSAQIMESLFLNNLGNLIGLQQPKVKAGENIAVFSAAYEGHDFTFRQLGSDADVILLLAHIIHASAHVGPLLKNALKMAKNTMSGLNDMFIRSTRYEIKYIEKINRR